LKRERKKMETDHLGEEWEPAGQEGRAIAQEKKGSEEKKGLERQTLGTKEGVGKKKKKRDGP